MRTLLSTKNTLISYFLKIFILVSTLAVITGCVGISVSESNSEKEGKRILPKILSYKVAVVDFNGNVLKEIDGVVHDNAVINQDGTIDDSTTGSIVIKDKIENVGPNAKVIITYKVKGNETKVFINGAIQSISGDVGTVKYDFGSGHYAVYTIASHDTVNDKLIQKSYSVTIDLNNN